MVLGAAMSGVTLFAVQRAWAYTVAALAQPVRQIARVAAAIACAFGAVMAGVYLLGLEAYAPRQFVAGWLGISLAAIVASRVGIAFLMRRWIGDGRLVRRAVIVGGGRPRRS